MIDGSNNCVSRSNNILVILKGIATSKIGTVHIAVTGIAVVCLVGVVAFGGPEGGVFQQVFRTRAVRIADGYFPGEGDIEQLSALLNRVRQAAEKAGRDPASIEFSAIFGSQITDPEKGVEQMSSPLLYRDAMQESEQRRDDLLLVIERASTIVEQVDLESLLNTTIDSAMELTNARYGALGVVDRHGHIEQF